MHQQQQFIGSLFMLPEEKNNVDLQKQKRQFAECIVGISFELGG